MITIILLLALGAGGWYWLHKHGSELARVRSELLVLQSVYEHIKEKAEGLGSK